jgi:hypothetical protein
MADALRAAWSQGRQAAGSQGTAGLGVIVEWLRSLVRPRILRQGVAAARRGNLDAAFALLREEVSLRPDRSESTLLFWGYALACERPGEAAAAMARLVRNEVAAGRPESAAGHWLALIAEVQDAVCEVAPLVRILPILRAQLAAARGDEAQQRARERMIYALRQCTDPRSGTLTPQLALRVVEEARGVEPEVLRAAAQVALSSSQLHEAKRARIEELMRAPDGALPEAATVAAAAAAPAEPPALPVKPRREPAPPAQPVRRAAARPPPVAPAAKREPAAAVTKPAAAPAAKREPAKRPSVVQEPARHEPPAREGAAARRTVALSDDAVEAAAARIAERMRGSSAAVSPAAAPAPAPAPAAKAVPAPAPATPEPVAVPAPAVAPEPAAVAAEDDADFLEYDAAVLETAGDLVDASADDLAIGTDLVASAGDALPTNLDDVLETDDVLAAGEEVLETDEVPLEADEVAIETDDAPLEMDEAPLAADARLRTDEITPVELAKDGLVAWELADARRTRIDYRAIEAIAAAEVAGLADAPVLVVDLVLRAPRAGRPRSALRMRADAFDATRLFPDRSDSGQALCALLSELFDRSGAMPLPDPDSALGLRPQRFASLADYERALLERLA